MVRLPGSQSFEHVEAASRGAPQRGLPSLGTALKPLAAATRRALAAAEAAVAAFFFWHDVSRRIEGLMALDDAALKRRGLERNEIVPAVFRSARARRDRRRA